MKNFEPTNRDILDVLQILRTDVSELKTDVSELKTDVSELKTDVSELKSDISEVKTDVSSLKTDVSSLKAGQAELKTDVRSLKAGQEELAEAISDLSTQTDTRFDRLEGEMKQVKGEVAKTRSEMVTKDYLDRQLFNFKGDLNATLRQEDDKVVELVGALHIEGSLSEKSTNKILSMRPFPRRV